MCRFPLSKLRLPFRLYYRMNNIIQDNFGHSELQDTKNGE